jgi:hypothetical protein
VRVSYIVCCAAPNCRVDDIVVLVVVVVVVDTRM